MAQVAPSTTQIEAHVRRVRRNPRDAGLAVGIRSAARWAGGEDTLTVEGRAYDLAWCTGPLEARQRLTDHDASDRGLVIVTPLDEHELGVDVLARLAHGRLAPVRAWDLLLEQFQAHQLDPRVAAQRWIADALLAVAPDGGFDAVPAGVLDAQTVWRVLLDRRLGIRQHPVDLVTVLLWTRAGDALHRYAEIDEDFRRGLRGYLADACGPAAGAVLDCVDAGYGADAVPLGLACRAVFHESAGAEPAFPVGAARLEKYTLDHPLAPAVARQWAAAAEEVVRQVRAAADGANAARQLLDRGDQLLRDLKAEDYAHLSDVLPAGFERRLLRYAAELSAWLASRTTAAMEAVSTAAAAVAAHGQARLQEDRVRRVEMSARLARYLAQVPPVPAKPGPFEPMALGYAADGGFVDWARGVLAGESQAGVADAFSRLAAAVTEVRERENEAFGRALADWTAAAAKSLAVLPIESVLDDVVAPLAGQGSVLLVVLDGMSFAVYRELLEDLAARRGWVQLTGPRHPQDRPVLATIPSKTEFSRTSLLCGRLAGGGQPEAVKGFASHAGLLAAGGTGGEPLLYHKAELTEGAAGDLAGDLRKAIASARRVVGVVVNAVDDHLTKGDQVQPRWTVDYIRVLGPLLHEAAVGGRTVVLASDHGHVFDRQARFEKSDEGERWRSATVSPGPHEVLVAGPRVMAGGGRLVALWSERVHFGGKRHGYHGGLSPQEMLAPLAVLVPGSATRPEGWSEVGLYSPTWWEVRPLEPVGTEQPGELVVPKVPAKSSGLPKTLFDPVPADEPKPVVAPPPGQAVPGWVQGLLDSPLFVAQRKLAGRTPVADATARGLLQALSDRGGKMLRPALAKQLNVPPMRLPGLIAAMRRVLNVDGVDVLSVDEGSDSVSLDAERLKLQFDLK